MSVKICGRCKKEFPVEMFGKDKNSSDHLYAYCKVCTKEYRVKNKSYYDKYRMDHCEKEKASSRKTRNTLWGKYIKWKGSAKYRGIPFAITWEYIQSLPLICHYTGMPLTAEGNSWFTVSLDRLDSSNGYTMDNVVLCCQFINLMKHELTYDQFIRACAKVVDNYNQKQKGML